MPLLLDFVEQNYDHSYEPLSSLPGSSVRVEESSFNSFNPNEKNINEMRKMRGDDIMLNESFVSKHILTDVNNVALILNKSVILTNKQEIQKEMFIKQNLILECRKKETLNPKNIIRNVVYFKLANLGFPVNYSYINAKYIQQLLKSKHQIYEFKETDKELKFVISMRAYKPTQEDIDSRELWLGASHCQEGQEGKVFVMKQIRNVHHYQKETLKELKQVFKRGFNTKHVLKSTQQQKTLKNMKKELTKKIMQRTMQRENKKKVLKELIARTTRKKYKNTKITDYFMRKNNKKSLKTTRKKYKNTKMTDYFK